MDLDPEAAAAPTDEALLNPPGRRGAKLRAGPGINWQGAGYAVAAGYHLPVVVIVSTNRVWVHGGGPFLRPADDLPARSGVGFSILFY